MNFEYGTGRTFYRKIALSQDLITFFTEKRHYLSTDFSSSRYQDFIGEDAIPSLADAYRSTDGAEFLPFRNAGHSESTRIETDISTIIKGHYFEDRPIQNIERSYAVGTSTIPLRVQYTVEGSDEHHSFYIKRPDSNRIIGKYLYNLITGNQHQFWFTKEIFIEDDIPGTTLSYYDEETLLEQKAYLHELITKSLHAELLGLGPDTAQPRNRLVTTDYSIVLFDFNIMFEPQHRPFQLLEKYDLSTLSRDEIKTIYHDELDAVHQRIEGQKETFETFCEVTADLTDHMYMSITDRIRRYYGSTNLKDHLLSHLSYCKDCVDHFYD